MIPFIFFGIDIVTYALFDVWSISSLLAYFIHIQLYNPENRGLFFITVSLLCIEDYLLYGRFGLCLTYLIPAIALCYMVRKAFYKKILFLMQFLVFFCTFFIEQLVIKKWLFLRNIEVQSTITKILITVILVTLIVLSRRGNRFFALYKLKRGKSGLQTGGMPYKGGF